MKRILLVDDDEFIRKMYETGLGQASFEVILAENGKIALEKIKQTKPDLILLDVVMPEMNGFEFLSEIKKNSDLKEIPIIMLTNLGDQADVKKALSLGASDYIIKTEVTIKDVIKKIKKLKKT